MIKRAFFYQYSYTIIIYVDVTSNAFACTNKAHNNILTIIRRFIITVRGLVEGSLKSKKAPLKYC